MTRMRVLIADDHDLFRRGLREVLEEEGDIEVVDQAIDGAEAVLKTARHLPDVVFMDLNMPGEGGIEATAFINQHLPKVKVLVLTVSEEPEDLFRALGVGAHGYVLKNASPLEILEALRLVHRGWVVISPAMASRLLADFGPTTSKDVGSKGEQEQLTEGERVVLNLVARGLPSQEIALALGHTETEVRAQFKDILAKLHQKRRSEAAEYAARLGYLSQELGGIVEQTYRDFKDYLGRG